MTNFNKSCGTKRWVFAAGHIPLHSTGKEPVFTSHDKISILNASDADAEIELSIYYENHDPVLKYVLEVKAGRVRKIRMNDLIDPLPVPLDTPYSFTLESNVRVVVQFSRMNTAYRNLASFVVTPYHRRS